MKTLYLVRHAKSEWENEDIIDIDRPLSPRGYRDAKAMSLKLKEKGLIPDLLISSPAIRALSTSLIFCRNLGMNPADIRIVPSLYETAVPDYQNVIRGTKDSHSSLMLFAHNPTISNCAKAFAAEFSESMVTCAIVCIRSEVSAWSDFGMKASLAFYDFPKNG